MEAWWAKAQRDGEVCLDKEETIDPCQMASQSLATWEAGTAAVLGYQEET